MAINARSFLAGAGAALATVILGFGAGVTMTDALFGKGPREPNRLERRAVTEDVKTVGAATTVAALPAPPASPTSAVPTTPTSPTSAASQQGAAASASQPAEATPSTTTSQEQASVPAASSPAETTKSAQNSPNASQTAESRGAESRRAERQRQRAERRRIWVARRSRERDQELDAFAEQVRRQDGPSQFEEQPVQRAYTAERSFMPFRFGDD